jgi:hypothetical protein
VARRDRIRETTYRRKCGWLMSRRTQKAQVGMRTRPEKAIG